MKQTNKEIKSQHPIQSPNIEFLLNPPYKAFFAPIFCFPIPDTVEARNVRLEVPGRGGWMAQSVQCPPLDNTQGIDGGVLRPSAT